MIVIVIPLLPLAAVLLSWIPVGKRLAPTVTAVAALASLALTVMAARRVVEMQQIVAVPGWIVLDGFGATILLLVTFLSTTAALFSLGYIHVHEQEPARIRSYFVHFNLFTFSLALVPVLFQPALVWIAIEFTSIFSVLLVAFDNTREALEAAWKYIALMFMGAAIALLGFFILFWAQQQAGGGHYSWDGLRAVAPQMPPGPVLAAFLLILVGLGVKVGFVPLHTWLPDAHSQAPSPVCALLSGIKTTNSLYAILRLVPLLPAARLFGWMQFIGLLSLGVAAFLLLQVRDYKRMFAYSTVEHMGIIFAGAGLGGGGTYAAMLQIVSHSLTKSFCFLAAGATLLTLGTREIASVRGLIRTSPAVGAALLFGALAIGGAPPFTLFQSEFLIFRAGLDARQYVVTALLLSFVTVAFFGILRHANRMVFGLPADRAGSSHAHTALPLSCVLTLAIAAVPVVVLGLYQPASLHTLITLAAANLTPPLP
ncbi:MAG TPA: proton-conducting transporter membrane subunit [Vicinamibacterales bacterium]|nr:proton-conducting transporter membrane subunit [Vicinamibacterales bacterium]